jgi:hypothetical protein
MTAALGCLPAATVVVDPAPATPVFVDRDLRPLRAGTDPADLSRFGDDTWTSPQRSYGRARRRCSSPSPPPAADA